MAIVLRATNLAISPGITSSFLASGGTAPYVYSIAPGGVGGSIDPSTGLYTSPASGYGDDTVIATDSLAATASLDIFVGDALSLVCDIIKNQMGLADDQVYLWNQKFDITPDSRLYVVIGIIACKPFGNVNFQDGSGSGLASIQSLNMLATLSIDIFSRSTEALTRKEEVIMALKSNYAESQQEINSFGLGVLPTGFVNVSDEQGSAILYRFNISINLQYTVSKTQAVDYYDNYPGVTVTTEP